MSDAMKEQPTPEADRRIGMLLKGKWTLDRLLGVGGMANVYLAIHRNGSRVAVKMLHAHLAAHPDTLRRFLREGYLSNKVEHPDVVHILDDDVAPDGSPFLVMELLDGRSLDTILRERGPFELKAAIDIVSKVLNVLETAHAKGIVHRDLKPGNVFLLNGGAIKVLDFGIARLHETSMLDAATMSGAVLGTPSFMPPEQALGRWDDVDSRSDLWAMGAMLYMLLTNRSVRHEAQTVNEALMYAMSRPVAPMAQLVPGLPPSVARVIDRALAFDKAARWPSAATMRDGLTSALEGADRGGGETMILVDSPMASLLQTEGSSFVHGPPPPPGGHRDPMGATPAPTPFGGSTSAPPLPLFTNPHVLGGHTPAPAMTPQFAMKSLTPAGMSQLAPSGPSTLPTAGRSKVAIAGLAMLASVLVTVVIGAVVLSREDRPSTRANAHPSSEPSATTIAVIPKGIEAATTDSAVAIVEPQPSTTSAPTTTTTTTTTTTKPGVVKRPPPVPKNPLDQGRF